MGILEQFDLTALAPDDLDAVHLFAEASRLAYADRAAYIGDPDFVTLPDGLLDKTYLAERATLISPTRAMAMAEAGRPPSLGNKAPPPPSDGKGASTTHFNVIDGKGNAVAMTASIEGPFGSHVMVRGFFLNNELTDFSFFPEKDGTPIANAIAPGKRPRSSMAPTVIFDSKGHVMMLVGSPGGSRIISYVAKTMIGVLDWGLDIQEAIALPNLANRNGPTELEEHTPLTRLRAGLEARSHTVTFAEMTSGLHGILIWQGTQSGGADPRREGIVGRP